MTFSKFFKFTLTLSSRLWSSHFITSKLLLINVVLFTPRLTSPLDYFLSASLSPSPLLCGGRDTSAAILTTSQVTANHMIAYVRTQMMFPWQAERTLQLQTGTRELTCLNSHVTLGPVVPVRKVEVTWRMKGQWEEVWQCLSCVGDRILKD